MKQRLAAKVAALREARHAEERAAATEAAKKFRASNGRANLKPGSKRKRDASTGSGGGGGTPKTKKISHADFQK